MGRTKSIIVLLIVVTIAGGAFAVSTSAVEADMSAITDTDGDGLSTVSELQGETDPFSKHSDDDTVDDGEELKLGTSPTNDDTDGDGVPDGVEVDHGLSPLDATSDSDSDGIANFVEIRLGTNPTEPTVNSGEDPDSDGLSTSFERKTPLDPNSKDTDGDGLPDGSEVYNTEHFPNADPLSKDVYVEIDTVNDNFDTGLEHRANLIINNNEEYGFTLHIVHDEKNSQGTFDNYKQGYYHASVINSLNQSRFEAGTNGYASISKDRMVIERESARLFVHELGHLLGLVPFVHDGIDSNKYTPEQYPSVMSYSTDANRGHKYGYSTGDAGPNDHNDWETIYFEMKANTDTTRLHPQRHLNKTA